MFQLCIGRWIDFTLSAADDLMDCWRGMHQFLVLPGEAGVAGEQEEQGQ